MMKHIQDLPCLRRTTAQWGRKLFIAMLLLSLGAAFLVTGCSNPVAATKPIQEPIKIGSLSGPTGIGMVHLMEDPAAYQVAVFQTPDEVAAKVISGELDVAALPSNLAAVLFNKLEGGVVLLATNTLGTLYILENGDAVKSVADLKGKTILASGKGGTPEYILNQVLDAAGLDPETDVTIKWLTSHADAATALAAEAGAIGVLPMGVLIARKSFAESRQADLTVFLAAYAASVEKVNRDPAVASLLVAKHKVIADAAVAEKAIPACNIVYVPAQAGKTDLVKFFQIISKMNPKSIGGKLPDETFYYAPKR